MRERTRKLAVLIIMLFIGSPLIAQEPYAKLDAYFTQWNRTGRLNGTVLVAEKGRASIKRDLVTQIWSGLYPIHRIRSSRSRQSRNNLPPS